MVKVISSMEGWIKLHRDMLKWEWYDDQKVKSLFLHCILKANFESKQWRGINIIQGSFITSNQKLSIETGLSLKEVRNCLEKLISTGEIEKIPVKGKQFTHVKVCKYDIYQDDFAKQGIQKAKKGHSKDKGRAFEGHSKGNQRATTKKEKNYKNLNNEKKEEEIKISNDFFKEEKVLENVYQFFDAEVIKSLNQIDKKNWITEIQQLHKIDGYDFQIIEDTIIWARQHNFWNGVFLSIDGLSKKTGGVSKFQKIYNQYKNGNNNIKGIEKNEFEQLAKDIYDDPRLH